MTQFACYAVMKDNDGHEIGERKTCIIEIDGDQASIITPVEFEPLDHAGHYWVDLVREEDAATVGGFGPLIGVGMDVITLEPERAPIPAT